EREVQLEFLLHLGEFDARRAWAEAGYPSLWEWSLRVLHLREGAAGRRIAAMRVLRTFPVLAGALRDGRLCLSTAALLAPVLNGENCAAVVDRAAFLKKAEVEHLVASLAPRVAPQDGIRLTGTHARAAATAAPATSPLPLKPGVVALPEQAVASAMPNRLAPPSAAVQVASPVAQPRLAPAPAAPRPPEVRAVSADAYSLRVTLDARLKADLDTLRSLLAHKVPNGDLAAVLREAVKCAIEKHGKRKGAIEPSRTRKVQPSGDKATPSAPNAEPASRTQREPIPLAVRREVWKRDGGRCAWRSADGHVCGSTWKLELDHVVPAALGGPSTVENLRVHCRSHNMLAAERAFGRAHMEQFRGTSPGRVKVLLPAAVTCSEYGAGGRAGVP
ncbi:MAG: HNH endonuclease, partial [Anaeromyxobacteraceae bacterium]